MILTGTERNSGATPVCIHEYMHLCTHAYIHTCMSKTDALPLGHPTHCMATSLLCSPGPGPVLRIYATSHALCDFRSYLIYFIWKGNWGGLTPLYHTQVQWHEVCKLCIDTQLLVWTMTADVNIGVASPFWRIFASLTCMYTYVHTFQINEC